MVHATNMNKSKDPYSIDLEISERFYTNIISALNGYDVSTNLLTEDQILYTFELGICAGQSYSV